MQTRTIPWLARYIFREDGNVISTCRGEARLIHGFKCKLGYTRIDLAHVRGGRKTMLRSRLICEAFHGPPAPEMQCRHLDGNPRNDRPENLAWGTASENAMDKHRHGTAQIEGRNPNVKFTRDDVYYIRANPQASLTSLANHFGVSLNAVYSVRIGRTWRWLK